MKKSERFRCMRCDKLSRSGKWVRANKEEKAAGAIDVMVCQNCIVRKPKMAKFALRIPESDMKQLKALSKKWKHSINAIVGAAIADWLGGI